MLEQVLTYIHNWFRVRDDVDGIHSGEYTIQDGGITLPFLQEGQYFRIIGSVFNDGLHKYGPDMETLRDETFDGAVWALAVPQKVIDGSNELDEIDAKEKEITLAFAKNGFTSESKADYSYQKDIALQLSALKERKKEIMEQLAKEYQKIKGVWG